MIYLTKDIENIILITIGDEAIDIATPYYYLSLLHIATNTSYFIDLGNDQSPNPERFNRFTFTAPALKDGQYRYSVFLSDGVAVDINDSNLVKVLEAGLAEHLYNDTAFSSYADNVTYYEPNI